MRILFLTSRFPKNNDHFTLEKELVHAFAADGHECTVANILEKKHGRATFLETLQDNTKFKVELLNIRTGNLFNNVSMLEKKITVLSLPYLIPRAIKKFLGLHDFDCIIAYGPYLCSSNIIKPVKKYFNCPAVLVQWDIFPQNAYDLGIIKNKLLLTFFTYKQKSQLKHYELILCNSQGNIDYLQAKFPSETAHKLQLFHNCESAPRATKDLLNKSFILQKYNLDKEAVLLIFGGNIGIPQALENIVSIADLLNHNKKIHFIISGQGTEAAKIKDLCSTRQNITFIDFLPSTEYEQLLTACHYGIISLSPKFTVPNFPAKVTSYLKLGIPIFACIDDTASKDLGNFINNHNVGLSINAKDYKKFINQIESFLLNASFHEEQSLQAKKIFNKYFNIHNNYAELAKKLAIITQASSHEPV